MAFTARFTAAATGPSANSLEATESVVLHRSVRIPRELNLEERSG